MGLLFCLFHYKLFSSSSVTTEKGLDGWPTITGAEEIEARVDYQVQATDTRPLTLIAPAAAP